MLQCKHCGKLIQWRKFGVRFYAVDLSGEDHQCKPLSADHRAEFERRIKSLTEKHGIAIRR